MKEKKTGIIIAALFLIAVGVIIISRSNRGADISSFEECEKAGNAIMESYPRKCATADGVTFTENVSGNGQQMVGGDADEHGCIGSAGYSWCEPKAKCLRLWEENCEDSAADQIRYILSLKYEKPVEDVNVTVSKAVDTFVSGSVKFGGAGGGQFLAYQKDGVWMVVYDGNGSIDCDQMRNEYGFPDVILKPNFCD